MLVGEAFYRTLPPTVGLARPTSAGSERSILMTWATMTSMPSPRGRAGVVVSLLPVN